MMKPPIFSKTRLPKLLHTHVPIAYDCPRELQRKQKASKPSKSAHVETPHAQTGMGVEGRQHEGIPLAMDNLRSKAIRALVPWCLQT
eukprot:632407-Pyramimonas_sp.AAC.1